MTFSDFSPSYSTTSAATTNSLAPDKKSDWSLFGPLSKNWCVYFYILEIIFLLLIIGSIVSIVYYTYKRDYLQVQLAGPYLLFAFGFYIQNRLLYPVCNKTL